MSRSQFAIALIFVVFIVGSQACLEDIKYIPKFFWNVLFGEPAKNPISQKEEAREDLKYVGYPESLLFGDVHDVCSLAFPVNAIKKRVKPDFEKINLQLRTSCKRYSYPLREIWQKYGAEFDTTKKVVIFVTGWTYRINTSDTIDVLAKAYNCRGDVNFLALDAADYVDSLYTWAALDTVLIGSVLTDALIRLVRVVPLENIHLIGHGLGAHIVGTAGRFFNLDTGKLIPRITGLDPAKSCVNDNFIGLRRGYAKFVDVIHSNPGALGKSESIGDVDFYPGGLTPIPSGCVHNVCAHLRSYEYYAESVYPGNEQNFMAARCTSQTELTREQCVGAEYPMGYATPNSIKGNYFLEVNRASPYGKGSYASLMMSQENCGVCKYV